MSGSDRKDSPIAQKQTVGQSDSSTQLFQAASRGWRIFPVKFRDKTPLVKGWPNLATTDRAKISEWLRKYPQCNWGLATGFGSGLLVLDADSDEALSELEKLGSMPQTFTVKTGRGRHFYFEFPPNCAIRNSANILAHKLDVRGEGGYVLMPPSIHPSGVPYEILDDHLPAPTPQWLLKQLTSSSRESARHASTEGRAVGNKGIEEGGRNASLVSMAGTMKGAGFRVKRLRRPCSVRTKCNVSRLFRRAN